MSANKRATGGREPRRYEIRVRGPIGPTMMQAFPTLAAASRGQDTLLTGSLAGPVRSVRRHPPARGTRPRAAGDPLSADRPAIERF